MPGNVWRIISLVCTLLWAGTIWYLSDQPAIEITPVFEHQDKLLHLGAYFVLGVFAMGAMRTGLRGYSRHQYGLAIVLTGLYGLLDEFHQSFIPGRDASLLDGLADISGGILGAGLLFLLVRRFARHDSTGAMRPEL